MSNHRGNPQEYDEGTMMRASATAIDREMRTLMARSRSYSTKVTRSVHPDLNPSVYGTLIDITEREPVRAVDLAERRGVTKGLLSREIRILERLGMVEREIDEDDGRAFSLRSTEIGRAAAGQAHDSRLEYTRRLLSTCTPEELVMMAHSLKRLNELLEAELPLPHHEDSSTEPAVIGKLHRS